MTYKRLMVPTAMHDLGVEPLNLPLHDLSCWLLASVRGGWPGTAMQNP